MLTLIQLVWPILVCNLSHIKGSDFLKKILLFTSFILTLSLFSPSPSYATNLTTDNHQLTSEDLNKANEFRNLYGFDEKIDLSLSSYDSKSKLTYGVYLTTEELKTINAREEMIDHGVALQNIILNSSDSKLSDSFGGIYFDHLLEGGKLRVAVVEASPKNKEIASLASGMDSFLRTKNSTDIETYNVKYSYSELEDFQQKINDLFIEFEMKSFYSSISIPDNKIQIGVDTTDGNFNDFLEKVNTIIDKNHYVIFHHDTVDEGFSRTAYTRPLVGGLQITSSSTCTGAFTGLTASNKKVYVTAAHCSEGYPSYSQGGSTIGSVITRSFDSGVSGIPNYYSDAAGIEITGTVSGGLYGELNYAEYIKSNSSYLVGSMVCKSGRSTDITCGILRSTSYSFGLSYKDNLYLLSDHFTATTNSASGDSGAPAYRRNLPTVSPGTTLLGTLSSGTTVNNEFVTIYSKLPRVMSDLGITKIYLLSGIAL